MTAVHDILRTGSPGPAPADPSPQRSPLPELEPEPSSFADRFLVGLFVVVPLLAVAAAVPLVFTTAWHMLFGRAGLRPGEDVLVIGAGSGVGSAAIQIAKLVGSRVIATAGTDAKLEKARQLGADEVINHTKQSIADEVRRLTDRRGVGVIVEHVGAAVWEACFNSLATYGRLVTCGVTSGAEVKLNVQALFGRQRTILGSFVGGKAELIDALKFIAQRKLRAVIDSAFPLQDAATAQKKMESRDFFGKILLHP